MNFVSFSCMGAHLMGGESPPCLGAAAGNGCLPEWGVFTSVTKDTVFGASRR